ILLLAICVYLAGLAVVTYFTRAPQRRFLGALAGGVGGAVVGVWGEGPFQTLGVLCFPSPRQPYGPLFMYSLIVLMSAADSLIGWRVMRRFGWRGQVVFVAALMVLGTLRDYLVAGQALGFIALAPGIMTMIVDAVCWAGLTALAQGVMWLVAGPALADRLARR